MIRKAGILTAALVAAVFLWLAATLPPRPAIATGTVAGDIRARTVAGAFHVHSNRSDGVGSREDIAAAAASAGLQFVVITDHGDATNVPNAPAYLRGVLCLDAVEISTNGGHLIAFDMPPSSYPLGGEAAAVVEDVLRLGGMPISAHPDSPKQELAWRSWDSRVAGLEWLNLDSAWRGKSFARLARTAAQSIFRPAPALAATLTRPDSTFATWDGLAKSRPVVGLAGHDAHGGLMRAEGTEKDEPWPLPGFGSYEVGFRTFSTRVVLDEGLSGDPARDARQLSDSLRRGRVFTAVDAIAGPAAVDFSASLGGARHEMGSEIVVAQPLHLTFRSTAPPGAIAVLFADGVEAARSASGEIQFAVPGPGAYRAEVRAGTADVPWIVTNPIYVRGGTSTMSGAGADSDGTTVMELVDGGSIEKDDGSTATLEQEDGRRTMAFRLRAGERVSQYAALAVPLPKEGLATFDRVALTGKSSRPLRVSVQLRFDTASGARWGHSVYLSPDAREVVIPLDRLVSMDRPGQTLPASAPSSLLFVVDLTNAAPGSDGEFEISNLRLTRR
jgi:hypothetical protein